MKTPFGKAATNPSDLDWFLGHDETINLAVEVWPLLNHFRGYIIEDVAPHFLFLFTLERYGYLSKVDTLDEIEALFLSEEVNDLPYSAILREIFTNGNLLLNMSSSAESRDVLAQIKEIDTPYFRENFSRFFDDLLHRMFNTNTKVGGTYLLTDHVKWLLTTAAEIKKGSDVYNPFAGLASFGMNLPEGASYWGQEINNHIYDFARLRAVAHNVDFGEDFVITNEDTFTNWPANRKFDVVISTPPFGIRLNKYSREISSLRGAQNFLVRNGVKLLKPKGKLVALVTEGFLFRGGTEMKTRRYLVENDLIETVFAIPQGMLIGTSVASTILVINKDKKTKGKIKFAAPMVLDLGKDMGGLMFMGEPIKDLNQLDDPDYSSGFRHGALVNNEVVANHNFNLTPKRHLLSDVTGTPLSELLTPLSGTSIKGRYSGYLTTIKDLVEEETENYSISFPTLTEDDMATGQYVLPRGTRKLDDNVLLVAVTGRKLKPSYFSSKSNNGQKFPLYLSPQVKAFKFNHDLLERDYLIHQLRSNLVKKQLEAYQTGTGIPRLKLEDFLRIRIQLPSREEQHLTIRALKEVNKKMEALVQERNALAHGAKVERNTRFATLKHALGRPQQSILSAAKTIKGYLDHIGERGENLNSEYAEFFEQERNVSDTLQGIINDVDFISRLMDRGENGLQVDSYELQHFSLAEVLKSVKELNSTGFKFKLKTRAEATKDWENLSVELNSQLLRVLLDNLLTNADKHGFEEKAPGNLVQITLSIIDYHLVVEIQNNGKPFPLKFGKEQYIQEFKTNDTDQGQGIGGYQVDQIAKRFEDPDWELLTEANEIFPVTFIFRFPISETVATIDNDGKIHPHE